VIYINLYKAELMRYGAIIGAGEWWRKQHLQQQVIVTWPARNVANWW